MGSNKLWILKNGASIRFDGGSDSYKSSGAVDPWLPEGVVLVSEYENPNAHQESYRFHKEIESAYLEWLRGERERIALTLGTESPEFAKINSQILDIVDNNAKEPSCDN